MDAAQERRRRAPNLATPVLLLVAALCLAIVAAALAAAGGIELADTQAPLSAIRDAGRLTSARILVCVVAAIGLAGIGVRGLLDGSTALLARRLQLLGVAIAILSSWNGLWLTAGLTSVLAIGAAVGVRVSRDRQHVTSDQAS